VFAAHADPARPRLEHATVADLREVLDLDLERFGAGDSSGLQPYHGSLLCVCTNGRHDACCAEFGRPVAMALDDAYPEETWEVSHIGGDRFAGNMVVLPHGLYYGRLDPEAGVKIAGAHLQGRLDLDHLRGRSSYPMPVQAAEIQLRRELGLTGLDEVMVVAVRRDGDVTECTLAAGGVRRVARVRTTPGPMSRLTCKAHRQNPPPLHHVVLDR